MSASRASNPIRAVSVWTHAHHDGCKGDLGQPDLPKVQRLGSRKERTGQGEQHATSIVPCASSLLNTGNLPKHNKASGQEEGGDPGRHAKVSGRWRMGRRSLHVGKPRTPG